MEFKVEEAKLADASMLDIFLTKLIVDEKKYDANINEGCVVKDLYKHFIENDNNCILVVKKNKQIVGYLYGYLKEKSDAYLKGQAVIEAMYIDFDYRGHKLGTDLIKHFIVWAKDKNASFVELKVCNENKVAMGLYEKVGFKSVKSTMILEIKN